MITEHTTVANPVRNKRIFVSESFTADNWQAVEPYYQNLQERDIQNQEELEQWLQDWSELETVLSEDSRWTYVRTTIDTRDEQAKAALVNLYTQVHPNMMARENLLKKKFIESPFINNLDQDLFYTTIRRIKNDIEIFREENIPVQSELSLKQSEFDRITGAQSIVFKGAELTVQQATNLLKSTDRKEREEVYSKLNERRLQDADRLDDLLSELIGLRHRLAINAGYKNYVDFRFAELGRFDYTPDDCIRFHGVVEKIVMPLVDNLAAERKKQLGLDVLRPWDTEVDVSGKPQLRPFRSTAELIQKTIDCFNLLDPYFGERISIMKQMRYLDLDSRMHKGTGGYNMSMPEIGVPFIFMNSVNSDQDLITMVHEGGHAIQTFLTHPLQLGIFKEITPEIAEVASMSMELLSMEHWDIFYSAPDDLKRAKRNHLQYILVLLTRACLGDSFQFWLYSNPQHTIEERRQKWAELHQRFNPKEIDYTGYQEGVAAGYQRILHFYIVPFYYIEYAFAQLGALAIWRNFKHDPALCIHHYKEALSLGYTKTIPEFYETAGTRFDFSETYVASLCGFLELELKKL